MATESEMRRQILDLQQSYEDAKARNASIFGKIETLENAKRHVDAAKGHVNDFKRGVKDIELDGRWAGKRRNGADNGRDRVTEDADALAGALGDLGWQLFCEIIGLRTQVDYLTLLMSNAEEGIEDLTRSIKELVDGD